MSSKMHISHAIAISMFPYLEIMFKDEELAWEISDFLELEEDEIKSFRPKEIPKKSIEKMEKQKAQMRVEERDRRFEELQNQMINSIEDTVFEEPEIEIEEIVEETVEEDEIIEEESSEEEPKKKTDKQVSLFSF